RRSALLGLTALAAVPKARAEQTITVLIGAELRSVADQQARTFLPFLQRHLGTTTVTLKNVPDPTGLAALVSVAKAPADGSVLGWAATPELTARLIEHDADAL